MRKRAGIRIEQDFSEGLVNMMGMIHPLVTEAYKFAIRKPEQLAGINCSCRCEHGGSLLDCFVAKSGKIEEHASGCGKCIADALEVKRMTEKGFSKGEVRRGIKAMRLERRIARRKFAA